MNGEPATISSSSPPVCPELYVGSVMLKTKTQAFPIQSHQVGEKIRRQTSASALGSTDFEIGLAISIVWHATVREVQKPK